MSNGIEVLFGGDSYFVYSTDERERCLAAEDLIRDFAEKGLVSYIAHLTDPDQRERVRTYLGDVMTEITHDAMVGL